MNAVNWSTPADLRLQVQRLWDRGDLLRSVLALEYADKFDINESKTVEFPRRLTFKKPASKQISDQFEQVRAWIQSLRQCKHVRIEFRESRHPILGRNEIPYSAWVDSLDEALLLISRATDAKRFNDIARLIVTHDVRLLKWLYKRPQKALELYLAIEKLIKVHDKICSTPCSEIYLRQLSVAGVDTKFIEQHRDTLADWLDLTLPVHRIDDSYQGVKGFANRYGFRDKPLRLRLRSLDARYPFPDSTQLLSGAAADASHSDNNDLKLALAQADLTLDVSVVRQLQPRHSRVLITENEINYLALPSISKTLALFGAGYGWRSLQQISWLHSCQIFYWGDIDTHGFAILDDLRQYFPAVESFLMDRETLLAHEGFWGKEPTPASRTPDRLTKGESGLYNELINNRYGENVRLEQEQLDFEWVSQRLTAW